MHCYIAGQVQGVGFRQHARKQAQRFNLVGWARNLADGRVEVLACGEFTNVNEFINWLHIGPARSEVREVTREECPWQDLPDFTILASVE